MVSSDTFAKFLRELLGPLGRVTMRRMFGKTGVFCDGVMLGMVTASKRGCIVRITGWPGREVRVMRQLFAVASNFAH